MNVSEPEKIQWSGTIVSIQPRTAVWRYRLDNRTHYHRGYIIFLDGETGGALKITKKAEQTDAAFPPYMIEPLDMKTYELRGARMLSSASLYKMGKPRAVPYKDCGSDFDTGWMDELCTQWRGDDEWENGDDIRKRV